MYKKKVDELKQLRTFYSKAEYKIIRQDENPDFILKDSKNNIFGVEVTKFYDSPTSGRMKNLPNYSDKLLKEGFIHKEDKGILEFVEDIVKIGDDGKEIPQTKISKGVLRKLPQSPDRIKILKELVATKNIKYLKYDKSLKVIDLLIYDSGDLIAGEEIQKIQILNYLHKQEKANTLVSPFRNIILIIEDPLNKRIIKMILKSGSLYKEL